MINIAPSSLVPLPSSIPSSPLIRPEVVVDIPDNNEEHQSIKSNNLPIIQSDAQLSASGASYYGTVEGLYLDRQPTLHVPQSRSCYGVLANVLDRVVPGFILVGLALGMYVGMSASFIFLRNIQGLSTSMLIDFRSALFCGIPSRLILEAKLYVREVQPPLPGVQANCCSREELKQWGKVAFLAITAAAMVASIHSVLVDDLIGSIAGISIFTTWALCPLGMVMDPSQLNRALERRS